MESDGCSRDGEEPCLFCTGECGIRELGRQASLQQQRDHVDCEREMGAMGEADNETFEVQVNRVCGDVARLLVEKNKKYGNSALAPLRVFSSADTVEQLKVRIDDKLSRIRGGVTDDEDTVLDLLGYLVILRIAQRAAK